MIENKDGHVSELRCSLPLYILDNRLYGEAHAATLATRRLLLGSRDVDGGQASGTHGESSDEEDLELPAYPEHVRDRVANAYLPEAATMRVTNPWIAQGVSPVIHGHRQTTMSTVSSGMVSPAPLEVFPYHASHEHDLRNQLPADPSADPQQLHWVTTELLLSLTDQPEARISTPRRSPEDNTSPEVDSGRNSRQGSRFHSRGGSRSNSRAASPERLSNESMRPSLYTPPTSNSVGQDKTYVHNLSAASRNMHGLFQMSMKPFTTLSGGFGIGHRTHSGSNLAANFAGHGPSGLSSMSSTIHSAPDVNRGSRPPSRGSSPSSSGLNTPALPRNATEDQVLLHRAFVETPDYEIASRGFLGGGIPPLSSFAGLPSYEEAAGRPPADRSMSEADLSGRVQQALRVSSPSPHGHRGRAAAEVAGGATTAPPSPPRRSTEV